MTRDELRKELKAGVKLEDIFEFTDGQDCLIYKGKFLPGIIGDDICYISDLSLVDIPVNKSIVKSYEIDSVMGRCYTTNDFIKECNGHEILQKIYLIMLIGKLLILMILWKGTMIRSSFLKNIDFLWTICL